MLTVNLQGGKAWIVGSHRAQCWGLCFLIFVNDIPSVASKPLKLFVDDTKVYGDVTSQENIKALQSDIDAIVKWTSIWQLPLNTNKCHTLHLGHRNPRHTYHIAGNMIEGVTNERD